MTKARTLADNFAADINGITAGTGITGGGTSGTVTVTNSMATEIDAKGDLVVGTGADTFSRLAVASTAGYLLSVDSGETTGLKWSAPAGGGSLQLVKRGTFSGVANTGTTFDDVFTSTYVSYLLNFEFVSASTTANDLEMLLRNTGPTTRTANYKSASGRLTFGATTSTYYGADNDDFWQLTQDTYGGGYLFFNRTNSSLQGFYYSEANMAWYAIQLQNGAGGGSIGFQLRSSSSNITGQISVYGLAQA
jgi:hypothetical protein